MQQGRKGEEEEEKGKAEERETKGIRGKVEKEKNGKGRGLIGRTEEVEEERNKEMHRERTWRGLRRRWKKDTY